MSSLQLIQQLLPKGLFWEIGRESCFYKLLLASSQELDRVDDAIQNLSPPQLKYSPGNLSRIYVEGKLRQLGYSDFKIHDPSEMAQGLEPILDPSLFGVIGVEMEMRDFIPLRAGFHAGDTVAEWRNFQFEKDLNTLIPAWIQARFIYKRKDDPHATRFSK